MHDVAVLVEQLCHRHQLHGLWTLQLHLGEVLKNLRQEVLQLLNLGLCKTNKVGDGGVVWCGVWVESKNHVEAHLEHLEQCRKTDRELSSFFS